MTGAVIAAALAFWRRHPFRAVTLILGLALATALWSGVQAINAEARRAYADAADTLSGGGADRLTAPGDITPETHAALARAGWRTSPVIEGRIDREGGSVRVLGLDILTAPPGSAGDGAEVDPGNFLTGRVSLAAPATAARLPDLGAVATEGIAGGVVVMDLRAAAALLNRSDYDYLLLHPDQPLRRPPLDRIAPDLTVESAAEATLDTARLTDSFHLNLTAFGLLAFATGLFIVYGAIGLAVEERRSTFRTLRALGAPRRLVTGVLAAELLAAALIGGLIGIAAGYVIAGALLPGVAATLRGLYGATVEGALTLSPVWWLGGLLVSVAGTALAAATALLRVARMPILAAARPRAWARASQAARLRQVGAATLFLILGGVAWQALGGLAGGFALLAGLLLGAALLLPPLLDAILSRLPARGVRAEWFLADTRHGLPGLSLALMALLLALSANIGVGTMVGSFRDTFTGWLDQRLASELYVTLEDADDLAAFETFLDGRADAILPIWQSQTTLGGVPAEVYSVSDHATYRDHWPLLAALPDAWDRVALGEAVLINEQLARRDDIWPGARIDLPGGAMEVAGVYSDYGNPLAQVLLAPDQLLARFDDTERRQFGLRVDPAQVDALASALVADFGLPPDNLIRQQEIKDLSLSVFERTFLVTEALNVLTLAVAAFAILTSLLTIAQMRLPQLAPVWASGLSRAALARMELARAVVLALLTFLIAIPVGLALAWVLLAIVNVEAFGWRLPMSLFPLDWARLALLTAVAAALAGLWPALRLSRMPPAALLKVFTHER